MLGLCKSSNSSSSSSKSEAPAGAARPARDASLQRLGGYGLQRPHCGYLPATASTAVRCWAASGLAILLTFVALLRGPSSVFHMRLLGVGVAPKSAEESSTSSFGIRVTYPGEMIAWERCGEADSRPLECTSIDVPMDHFNTSSNSAGRSFSVPLVRWRSANASAVNLLLNPGGPGASGTQFVWGYGKQLSDIVGPGFHLLSFDPRGVNRSVPSAVCYTDPEARRRAAMGTPNFRVPADSGELFARAAIHACACKESTEEYGEHINTPQTAADMNSILDAVGQKDMAYWGFSYGSLLGQTYATLFPERSWRVVIDGVVNQFDWYSTGVDSGWQVDADKVFDGFLDECIKAAELCALSSMAKTKEGLRELILNFANNLSEDPLGVHVNLSVHGLIYRSTIILNAIFRSLYAPSTWRGLAEHLAVLLQGNTTDFFLRYQNDPTFSGAGNDARDIVSFNDGLSGPDHWPGNRRDLEAVLSPTWNKSLFNGITITRGYNRAQWRIHRSHDFVPRTGVVTAHPLLILSTTLDPVCPLASARAARAAFVGSEIVQVKAYGHCTANAPSVCVTTHLRDYLYHGELPRGGAECEVDGNPYFGGSSVLLSGEQEMMKIHAAQVELARGLVLPRLL